MRTTLPQITHNLAERHEALWLRLSTLHKDICVIAAKKPDAPVGNTERATVEGLISDCRPFLKKPVDRLPVAAQNFAGLAVQLGQVLAQLEDFGNRHAYWDGKRLCRVWRVAGAPRPMARLRQEVVPYEPKTFKGRDLREALAKLERARDSRIYENGFAAGRSARLGPPSAVRRPPRAMHLWGSAWTMPKTTFEKLIPSPRRRHRMSASPRTGRSACELSGVCRSRSLSHGRAGSGIGPSRRAIKRRCGCCPKTRPPGWLLPHF